MRKTIIWQIHSQAIEDAAGIWWPIYNEIPTLAEAQETLALEQREDARCNDYSRRLKIVRVESTRQEFDEIS